PSPAGAGGGARSRSQPRRELPDGGPARDLRRARGADERRHSGAARAGAANRLCVLGQQRPQRRPRLARALGARARHGLPRPPAPGSTRLRAGRPRVHRRPPRRVLSWLCARFASARAELRGTDPLALPIPGVQSSGTAPLGVPRAPGAIPVTREPSSTSPGALAATRAPGAELHVPRRARRDARAHLRGAGADRRRPRADPSRPRADREGPRSASTPAARSPRVPPPSPWGDPPFPRTQGPSPREREGHPRLPRPSPRTDAPFPYA